MARLIEAPTVIEAAGNKPKKIEEFIGRMNSGTVAASVARMRSPQGWQEPGQAPEFDEYTLVIAGTLTVETRDGSFDVKANGFAPLVSFASGGLAEAWTGGCSDTPNIRGILGP